MIRLALILVMTVCGAAAAQPQPRITLDVPLTASAGFQFEPYAFTASLAVAGDGAVFIALKQVDDSEKDETEKKVRIDLLALARDGSQKFRVVVPATADRSTGSLKATVVPSGDVGVLHVFNDDGPGAMTSLYRFAPDGRLKKKSEIGPPSRRTGAPYGYYEIQHFQPTADNAVMLSGGFGSGPYGWWLGKFSLDGVRIFQSGPGQGFPENVSAMAARPQGHWLAMVLEMDPKGMGLDWYLHRYTPAGQQQSRVKVPAKGGYAAAILSDGGVVPIEDKLVYFNDLGRGVREVPWPFANTTSIVPAGDGFWAVVSGAAVDTPNLIVRVDGRGNVLWRTPPVGHTPSIARASDGQLMAVLRSADRATLRLVRYDDPP